MIDSGFPELSGRTVREARGTLARLEDENRAVRSELNLVLSSKAFRLFSILAHPLWVVRSTWSLLVGWKPLWAVNELWRNFRSHRVSLGTVAPIAGAGPAETPDFEASWIAELRISGEWREALRCPANSIFTFRTRIGPNARLRGHCAILPRMWDASVGGLQFLASVRGVSDDGPWERSASRLLRPVFSWQDRRWRPIEVELPAGAAGEVIVTLESRSTGAYPPGASAVWGDPALEWPRTADERTRLARGALRRLRWSGLGGTLEYALGRQRVEDQASVYAQWVERHRLDERALGDLRAELAALSYRPLISVITPVYNTPPELLASCIESVRRQVYEKWELCLTDDGSTSEATRATLRECGGDPRVRAVTLERNANISAASNAALSLATGEFIALLDHDDELAPEALAEVVRHLNAHPDADVIYSDEDKLDESGARSDPYFKPDWSPDFFLSYMYTCHLMVVRRRLVKDIGGFRVGFEGAQDYDLLLRLMEQTGRIHHIPRILYHWRKGETSTAASGTLKPWALEAGHRALEDYAERNHLEADVLAGSLPGMYRVRRAIRGEPLVSIVIPTTGRPRARGDDLLPRALRSLRKTTWGRIEVVLAVDREGLNEEARAAVAQLPHRIVNYDPRMPFNFPHKINLAVQHAAGAHVVLFNDDIEVITPDWLTAMLEHSERPEVGAVGAKLFYPDGRLQHVGMLVGVCGLAAHAFHRHPGQSPGYAGNALSIRNCSAVTAACLMTRRAVFDEVGGLDEQLPIDFNDVDFCLRVRHAGYRIVFTPYAQLYHHESASFGRRVQSARELALMRQRWGRTLDRDPYYSPNLSKNFSDYRLQV